MTVLFKTTEAVYTDSFPLILSATERPLHKTLCSIL